MRTISEKTRARAGGQKRVAARLKAELDIRQHQYEAWAAYVANLQSNRQRMERTGNPDAPFGALADRLAALTAMRRASSSSIRADVPNFPTIANRPGATAEHLAGRIIVPHPAMPGVPLTTPEIRYVVA
jgi:hypothetical protein